MMSFPTLDLLIPTKLIIFLYLLSIINIPSSSSSDRNSLVELTKTIKDDPSNFLKSWNESMDFCEWPGITCGRRHRRVTVVDLSSLKLAGSVPPHIGNLSFLRELYLENNSFYGEIPRDISHLHRLQILYLHNNSFIGSIPSNISASRNLVEINLMNNDLRGEIPGEIGSLTRLKSLDLKSNRLTGKIPHSLGNLTLLQEFAVEVNGLTGGIPDSLCRLSGLQFIVLNDNKLSGIVPESLFNQSSLVAIDIGANYLEGTFPQDLFINLPRLFFLDTVANYFPGNIPATLSNATNLQYFFTSLNGLTGKLPDLGNLRKLERFIVSDNNLVGDLNFLSSLVNATNLEILELGPNDFRGSLPTSISNLTTNLKQFILPDSRAFGKIPRGISNLIGLEILYLPHNQFTGDIPLEIGFLSNLKQLGLHFNSFSGMIPSSIGNLTLLTGVSLKANYLRGAIPSSLGKCKSLQQLALSQNNLSGHIPKEVLQLSSLSIGMNLSNNRLTGPIPRDVGELNNIGYLDVSYNSLSGDLPAELGSCVHLESLNLSNNNFRGPVPSSMTNLRGLQFLQLSHNHLTGGIPDFLQEFKFMQMLNLSNNELEGAVPTTGIFNDTSSFSVAGNTNLCGGLPELKLPRCNPTEPEKKKSKAYLKIVIPLVLLGILGLTLALLFLCLRLLKRRRKETSLLENNTLLRVSYHTVFKSTNGFSSHNLLGAGGFGVVYKGTLDGDGRVFAVKVLDLLHHGASRSFEAECEVLKSIRHRNLVKVLTACSGYDLQGNDFKAIVYEYMDNGSVENWLHSQGEESKWLSFGQRVSILIDVACALDYLHNDCDPAIIHCDLKPSNVLLDENMVAHVSDFGLARSLHPKVQPSSASTGVRGTIGYAPPEYGTGTKPSKSGDVYSFGVLILEMLTGKRPTSELFEDGLNLHTFAKAATLRDSAMEIVDPKILQEREEQLMIRNRMDTINQFQVCLVSMIKIGVVCSAESPADRISIHEAVSELNRARKSFFVQ